MINPQLIKRTAQSIKNDLENSHIDQDDLRCDSEELLNICLVLLNSEANTIEFFLSCIEIINEEDVESPL